jgi:hypothetical protein
MGRSLWPEGDGLLAVNLAMVTRASARLAQRRTYIPNREWFEAAPGSYS